MLKLVTGAASTILNTRTVPVSDPLAPEIQELIPAMVETMRAEAGIGIATPQIGQSLRLCVIEHEAEILTLINPEITTLSQEKIVFEEGCLSLPGQFYPIVRSEHLTVKFVNEKGLPKKLRAQGLLAIVIQHEVDHLDGLLIATRYEKQAPAAVRSAGMKL